MKISATSALVLNWTAPDVWTTANATDYTNRLDLSESEKLLGLFSEEEQYMHLQAVSNRKFFVRKKAIDFITLCRQKGALPQVIILAAGIAPLSVELSSLFPEAGIFDLDKYLMKEKEHFLQDSLPGIRFIDGDLTNLEGMDRQLKSRGWDPQKPTLVIMEGITYYLTEDALRGVIAYFAPFAIAMAGDFALQPEIVDEKARIFGTELFRKIKEAIDLKHIQYYDPAHFAALLKDYALTPLQRTLISDIQETFRGTAEPFSGTEPCWISMFSVSSRHPSLL